VQVIVEECISVQHEAVDVQYAAVLLLAVPSGSRLSSGSDRRCCSAALELQNYLLLGITPTANLYRRATVVAASLQASNGLSIAAADNKKGDY
jgi:hypothetical protein